MTSLLEMCAITKEFPGVKALDNVNLTVARGEIHAICGENGAGKSTLMKVLSGVYPAGTYDGEIRYDGQPAHFADINDSEELGIIIIHQELALVPLLTVAEQGREWGWSSGLALACYGLGALGVVLFVLAEHAMGEAALIPLRMFRIRVAAVTIAASVIIGMAMFGGIMILPLYMQIVHGASPTKAGILMLPMVAGMMAASISSGRVISRTGHVRLFPIIGSAVIVVGLFLLSFTTADTPLPLVSVSMFVLGLGLGSCMQPLLLTVQSAVPPTEIGVATASATFFRQMGGTLGVAIFLSILFSTVGPNISTALDEAATTPEFQQGVAQVGGLDESVVENIQDDSSVLETLPDAVAHPFRVGFAESMDLVFLSAAGVGVLAFLILLLLPPVELRATSASAARASGAGAPVAGAPAAPASPTSTPAAPRE